MEDFIGCMTIVRKSYQLFAIDIAFLGLPSGEVEPIMGTQTSVFM